MTTNSESVNCVEPVAPNLANGKGDVDVQAMANEVFKFTAHHTAEQNLAFVRSISETLNNPDKMKGDLPKLLLVDVDTKAADYIGHPPYRMSASKERHPLAMDDKIFAPKVGAYNPACAPGFGDKAGDIGWGMFGTTNGEGAVQVRQRTETSLTAAADPEFGGICHNYSGYINDSYLPFCDTTFTASEYVTKEGRMTARTIEYEDPQQITFQSADGDRQMDNVTSIQTNYDSKRDAYVTTITTADSPPRKYSAVQAADGSELPKWEQLPT